MKPHKLLLFTASLALAACAVYAPAPLPSLPDAQSAAALTNILYRNSEVVDARFQSESATAIDLSAPLDASAVATLAVLHNPDLYSLRATLGIAQAQVFAAGLMPDPTFSMGVDKVLSGPDELNALTAALGFDLNFLRTHAVQQTQAKAGEMQVRMDIAWAEWQTAGAARLLVARIGSLQQLHTLAVGNNALSQAALSSWQRAAQHGDVTSTQVQLASVAAIAAQQAVNQAKAELAAAKLDLNTLLGLAPDFPLQLAPLSATLAAAAALPALDVLFTQAAQSRADLVALRLGYDAQEAAVHKAVLDQFPALALTINGARDTGGNRLLGPALNFSLPLWNRNRGGIALEKATREVLQREYAARLLQTRADLAAALANVALATTQQHNLQQALPALQQLALGSRAAAMRGDLTVTAAAAAEQSVFDQQSQLVLAQQSLAEHWIALELLSGVARDQWSTQHE